MKKNKMKLMKELMRLFLRFFNMDFKMLMKKNKKLWFKVVNGIFMMLKNGHAIDLISGGD
jgi:uncharacterized protein YbaR (Trm112 family)